MGSQRVGHRLIDFYFHFFHIHIYLYTHAHIYIYTDIHTEEPGMLQPTGLQRVRHDLATEEHHTYIHTHLLNHTTQ